jgi:cupin superfamily acireductone dioxygenase involved in methionine salvage
MGQVTIYVEDSALEAAKRAAERAKVSVSQWFAKYAMEERQRQSQSWDAFFAEIDRLRDAGGDDFPTLEEIRAGEVPGSPRESW